MLIRKLRLQRGWTQDQLAEMAGVSVRTVQRLERGDAPSLEQETASLAYAKNVSEFYQGVIVYVVLAVVFFAKFGCSDLLESNRAALTLSRITHALPAISLLPIPPLTPVAPLRSGSPPRLHWTRSEPLLFPPTRVPS